jgi:hypothetical protein
MCRDFTGLRTTQPDPRDRLGLDGKEGVVGSSPTEGSRESTAGGLRRGLRLFRLAPDPAVGGERDRRARIGARWVELNPWAVEFRYEDDDEPPLDRRATLAFIEEICRWAGTFVDG